jgi:hypothetical protein
VTHADDEQAFRFALIGGERTLRSLHNFHDCEK